MGLLTQGDAGVFQEWFKEACKLHGIPVKYQYPIPYEDDVTIYGEIKPKFSEEIDIDIMFEQNPTVKTLKRIGWVSETPDDKPYIAYLPIDTPYLQTKARVLIPPIGQAIPGRLFEVTSIHSQLEYPDCYTCTLAPVMESEPEKIDYHETNYNHIDDNKANQPDEDSPNNYSVDVNFKFLKGI